MSKADLLANLETLSPEDLDEVAERLDQLRGSIVTEQEFQLVRARVEHYQKNPTDISSLDDAVAEILKVGE
jgi:hypothetical protein